MVGSKGGKNNGKINLNTLCKKQGREIQWKDKFEYNM